MLKRLKVNLISLNKDLDCFLFNTLIVDPLFSPVFSYTQDSLKLSLCHVFWVMYCNHVHVYLPADPYCGLRCH